MRDNGGKSDCAEFAKRIRQDGLGIEAGRSLRKAADDLSEAIAKGGGTEEDWDRQLDRLEAKFGLPPLPDPSEPPLATQTIEDATFAWMNAHPDEVEADLSGAERPFWACVQHVVLSLGRSFDTSQREVYVAWNTFQKERLKIDLTPKTSARISKEADIQAPESADVKFELGSEPTGTLMGAADLDEGGPHFRSQRLNHPEPPVPLPSVGMSGPSGPRDWDRTCVHCGNEVQGDGTCPTSPSGWHEPQPCAADVWQRTSRLNQREIDRLKDLVRARDAEIERLQDLIRTHEQEIKEQFLDEREES